MTIPDRHERFAAVHSVDEFVFTVPELEPARDFYKSFGLDLRDEEGALALYTFGHPTDGLALCRAAPPSACSGLRWESIRPILSASSGRSTSAKFREFQLPVELSWVACGFRARMA